MVLPANKEVVFIIIAYLEVRDALRKALPGENKVYFAVPAADAVQPCITYFESDNSPGVSADDTVCQWHLEYTVRIWVDVTDNRMADIIALDVERELTAIGFTRVRSADVPPNEQTGFHKQLIYQRDSNVVENLTY